MKKSLMMTLVIASSFATVGCLSSGRQQTVQEATDGANAMAEQAVQEHNEKVNEELDAMSAGDDGADAEDVATILPQTVEDPQGTAGFQSGSGMNPQSASRTPASVPGAHAVR